MYEAWKTDSERERDTSLIHDLLLRPWTEVIAMKFVDDDDDDDDNDDDDDDRLTRRQTNITMYNPQTAWFLYASLANSRRRQNGYPSSLAH